MKLTLLGIALAAAGSISAPAADAWSLRADAAPPSLTGFTGGEDLSGIAAVGPLFMVVSDEGAFVQSGRIGEDGRTITCTGLTPLPPGPDTATTEPSAKKKKKKDGAKPIEADIEGICLARDERAVYITGSHGVGKKKGDFQPARFGVWRLPVDPATGIIETAGITRSSLLPWLTAAPEFKDHVGRPLQLDGFNIEGLAWKAGRLFFGVRGPVADGTAWIIEIEATALFREAGRNLLPRLHRVPVGPSSGIREIVSVQDGFLIVTGNAAAEPVDRFPESTARLPDASFALHFIPMEAGGSLGSPRRLGDVSKPGGKAEGLAVLSESEKRIRVLVLHDGIDQGGATTFLIDRPAPDTP